MRLGGSFAVLLLSCHLADPDEPPKCDRYQRPLMGSCVFDETLVPSVTIAAASGGTSCSGNVATERAPTATPSPMRIDAGWDFRFKNDDSVAHVIQGTDGTTWTEVGAGAFSSFVSIEKVGTWPYRTAGCGAELGTIVVQ